jgi:hypothetical protein
MQGRRFKGRAPVLKTEGRQNIPGTLQGNEGKAQHNPPGQIALPRGPLFKDHPCGYIRKGEGFYRIPGLPPLQAEEQFRRRSRLNPGRGFFPDKMRNRARSGAGYGERNGRGEYAAAAEAHLKGFKPYPARALQGKLIFRHGPPFPFDTAGLHP